MKVNLDVQLTPMASALYRVLGRRVGRGFEVAEAQKAEIELKKKFKRLNREAKINDNFSRQIEKLNKDACSTNLHLTKNFIGSWRISCPRCGEYSADRLFPKAILEAAEKYAVDRELSLTQLLRYMGECY